MSKKMDIVAGGIFKCPSFRSMVRACRIANVPMLEAVAMKKIPTAQIGIM